MQISNGMIAQTETCDLAENSVLEELPPDFNEIDEPCVEEEEEETKKILPLFNEEKEEDVM